MSSRISIKKKPLLINHNTYNIALAIGSTLYSYVYYIQTQHGEMFPLNFRNYVINTTISFYSLLKICSKCARNKVCIKCDSDITTMLHIYKPIILVQMCTKQKFSLYTCQTRPKTRKTKYCTQTFGPIRFEYLQG